MSLELIGKIIVLNDTQTFDSGFQKRNLVIETQEQYKQTIPVDFVKDRIDLLDKFKVGDDVTVAYNLRGNEYKGKYFCSLNGWKIQHASSTGDETHTAAPYSQTPATTTNPLLDDDTDDNLPF